MSSAELVFCAPLTLPGQMLSSPETPVQEVVEALRDLQPPSTRPLSYAEAASGLQRLQEADYVYMRRGGVVPPLAPQYQGPYEVLARSQKFFSLAVGGRTEVVTVDRLKPHLGRAPVSAASPPQRGRPKRPDPAAASVCCPAASTGAGPCGG